MVDDKLRILAAMKRAWRERLTTVFPRQGHYALTARELQAYPAADVTLACIGELADCSLVGLLLAPSTGAAGRLRTCHQTVRGWTVFGRAVSPCRACWERC